MKKIVALMMALTLCLGLAACAPSGSENSEPPAQSQSGGEEEKQTIRIAVSLSVMDEGMTNLYNAMEAQAASYTDYNVELTYTNAEGSVDKQLSDIDALIAQEPDIIYVMCVDSDGVAPGIEAIKNAGILAAAGRKINSDQLDFLYVGFDQYSLGAVQAEWLQGVMDAEPDRQFNIGYIEGTAGQSSATERMEGFLENFVEPNADSGRVTVLAQADGNYKTDVAQSVVEDWMIAYPEMNVIVACNDEMAMGAVNAVRAAQRTDVMVLGADGLELSKDLVRDGELSMTVSIDTTKVGGGAVDKCVEAVLNGGSEEPVINMGTANLTVWDKDNLPG